MLLFGNLCIDLYYMKFSVFAVHLQLDRKNTLSSEFKHKDLHMQTVIKEPLDITTHLYCYMFYNLHMTVMSPP